MARHDEIYGELEKEIRLRPVGTRLPSFRALMTRFGSSQATVDRALQKLETDGFILRRHGSGIYVGAAARLLQARTDAVEFLVPDVANRAYSLIVRGAEEAARDLGFRAQVRSYGTAFPDPGKEPVAEARGIVVVPRSVDVDKGVVTRFLDALPKDVRRVLVEVDLPGRRCPFVGSDDFKAGAMAAEIFKKRKVARLACVGSSVSHVVRTRLSGLAASYGGMPDTLIDFPSPERFDREVLRRVAKSGTDGLFIARPDMALQTLCFLESLGVRVPEDLFVVTIAEEEDPASYPFRVAALVKPTLDLGREAVRALSAPEPLTVRLPYRSIGP